MPAAHLIAVQTEPRRHSFLGCLSGSDGRRIRKRFDCPEDPRRASSKTPQTALTASSPRRYRGWLTTSCAQPRAQATGVCPLKSAASCVTGRSAPRRAGGCVRLRQSSTN